MRIRLTDIYRNVRKMPNPRPPKPEWPGNPGGPQPPKGKDAQRKPQSQDACNHARRQEPPFGRIAPKTSPAHGWLPIGDRRTLTVFERIGCPSGLPRADEIPDGMMGTVVREMHRRFNSGGIHLSTLSPNVSPRELYEFMTGDFLRLEVTAAETPALHCFVYDAFRPDPWHENERRAVDYCIRLLLNRENRLHMFPNGRPITVNGHRDLSEPEFRRLMHAFRNAHSDIVCLQAEAIRTTVKDDRCLVQGKHLTGLCGEAHCRIAKGEWQVAFRREAHAWLIRSVRIEGIDL